ncbi:MAG: hypothetical protein MZV63_24280, partial [Marinilabiliales bacterium]|nr:hypothetical protein [Marinilabiliales bacterium]
CTSFSYVLLRLHKTPTTFFSTCLRIFFLNWLPKGNVGELVSAGILPLYNIFVGIEVAASILTIFLALVIFKEEISE